MTALAEVRFLRAAATRVPTALTISQREFCHDIAIAHLPIERAGSARYDTGTPVDIRWGTRFPNSRNRFYGYVHHTEPVYTRGGANVRTQTLKTVCIGASYRLKQPRQRVWKKRTVSSVVQETINGVKFSGEIEAHPQVWESLTNPGQSEWMFLAELAHRVGFAFYVSNTDAHFHNRITRFRRLQASAPVFTAQQPDALNDGDDVYSFHPVVGETTPDGGDNAIRVVQGVDPRFVRAIAAVDREGIPINEQLAKFSFAPEFLKYEAGVVAGNIGAAQALLEGMADKNRWHYVAKAEVVGVPSIRQGSPVFFDGLGLRDSGFWYVEGVEHVIRPSINGGDYRMYLDLGRDSSFLTKARPDEATARRVVRQRFDPFGTKKAALPPTSLVGGFWRSAWGAERAAS